MAKFKVGDVCRTLQPSSEIIITLIKYVGTIVTILDVRDGDPHDVRYAVEASDGFKFLIKEHCLVKIQDGSDQAINNRDQKISWDDHRVIWRPTKLKKKSRSEDEANLSTI